MQKIIGRLAKSTRAHGCVVCYHHFQFESSPGLPFAGGFTCVCCLFVTECVPFREVPSRINRCYSWKARCTSAFFSVETDKQHAHMLVKATGVSEARQSLLEIKAASPPFSDALTSPLFDRRVALRSAHWMAHVRQVFSCLTGLLCSRSCLCHQRIVSAVFCCGGNVLYVKFSYVWLRGLSAVRPYGAGAGPVLCSELSRQLRWWAEGPRVLHSEGRPQSEVDTGHSS